MNNLNLKKYFLFNIRYIKKLNLEKEKKLMSIIILSCVDKILLMLIISFIWPDIILMILMI